MATTELLADRPCAGALISACERGRGVGPRRVRAHRSQSARAAPALSHTSAATDRVMIGVAGEIHAHGLREDTGDVAVSQFDDRISWPAAERTAPDLACVIADGLQRKRG